MKYYLDEQDAGDDPADPEALDSGEGLAEHDARGNCGQRSRVTVHSVFIFLFNANAVAVADDWLRVDCGRWATAGIRRCRSGEVGCGLQPCVVTAGSGWAARQGFLDDARSGPGGAMMSAMALSTAFTKLFGVQHPIALAPMGGSAGGELAAAVSRGGGLGLLGGGYGDDRDWLARELPIVAGGGRPWGVGFLSWAAGVSAVEHALEYGPGAVMLSFGDPSPFVERIRAAGAAVIVQVTDLEEAQRALDLGADVIVAQGSEGGGHGARRGRATLPFVPVVVDLAAPVPVLAAGGIADGRGVAAALALGAAGALIGTRFQATAEALVDPSIAEAIVHGRGEDTERSGVLDIARGARWQTAKYTARSLGHPYLDRWRGREAELAADSQARHAYQVDVARGDVPPLPVWAGEGVDLIDDLPPAADLVAALAAQADNALARAGRY